MPALWASSERPMFVRTVWVDGIRHAILTKDDPLLQQSRRARRRRPASSVAFGAQTPGSKLARFRNQRLSHNGDQLEECFRKLQLVFNKEECADSASTLQDYRDSGESPIEKLNLHDLDSTSDEELVLKASAQPLYEFHSSRSNFASLNVDMRPQRPSKTCQKDTQDKCDLSDRVLHWLDLAGKIDLLSPEADNARITQPRHSCPEIQKRIPQHVARRIEQAKSESKECRIEDARAKRDANIDSSRHVIESYGRQSRQGEDTSARHERNAPSRINKSKDAPTKPADTMNYKGLKTDVLKEVNMATRRKVVSEIYDVERQYAEIMGRGLDPCGRHIKRQVHIFMPPVPKKSTSATASHGDTLLSHA